MYFNFCQDFFENHVVHCDKATWLLNVIIVKKKNYKKKTNLSQYYYRIITLQKSFI